MQFGRVPWAVACAIPHTMSWRGCHDIDVSDGLARSTRDSDARPGGGASIDELLDRAVAAINRGDRATAAALAGQVLADGANAEAEDLLAAPSDPGEIRRLTIFFADLVDSTVLSTRVEPQTIGSWWAAIASRYWRAVNRYEGHIGSLRVTDFWRSSVTRLPTRTTCAAPCTPAWK